MLKMPCTLIGYQFLIFICLLFSSSTYATKLGYSEVTFTNNSQEIINVKTDLITDDPKFKRGRDWQGLITTLAPYESKRVLWFSRHNNLQKNKKYTFTLALTQASYPGYP